ncbi:hypothetical protein, partial [Salmonella sp. s54836]|uniref:hypothetical protein n=1 Tax=Salmonella sp. s54836 TaxID=3159673 RepID=UPI00397FBF9D
MTNDTASLTGKSPQEKEKGFLVTKGRFIDIILVTLSIVILLFSFLAFVTIISSLVLTAFASNIPHHRCILYAQPSENKTDIVFGP